MGDISWVKEIDRISEELKEIGYYLKELHGIPVPEVIRREYRYVVDIEFIVRPIATCEIDTSYAITPWNLLPEGLYTKVFNGRTVDEYLTFYWLWQILSALAETKKEYIETKGIVLHLIWTQIGQLLRSLNLLREVRRFAEERGAPDFDKNIQPLITALSLSIGLAISFYESRISKNRDSSEFFGSGHLERDFLLFALNHPSELGEIRTFLDMFVKDIVVR